MLPPASNARLGWLVDRLREVVGLPTLDFFFGFHELKSSDEPRLEALSSKRPSPESDSESDPKLSFGLDIKLLKFKIEPDLERRLEGLLAKLW